MKNFAVFRRTVNVALVVNVGGGGGGGNFF